MAWGISFGKKREEAPIPAPVVSAAAVERALRHAAFRDPNARDHRKQVLRSAVRGLEAAAAGVDAALERLNEARSVVERSVTSNSDLMRGLLAGRYEELLDGLAGVAALAGDAGVNLIAGGSYGIYVDLDDGAFKYLLNPIDVRRGPHGLDLPVLTSAFEDDDETAHAAMCLQKAEARLQQFGKRLAHDAVMLAGVIEADDGVTDDLDMEYDPDADVAA